MTSDYATIRANNERRYGTDIGRIGRMLLADRYDDRTHFIFELLQNAEDALARRVIWSGSRAVTFNLSDTDLRITHFGQPFDGGDVLAICGIDESTKGLTAIGRFGIGFKSVYAFTDRPEVHSGEEDFAVESFVWPVAVPTVHRQPDETAFVLPLKGADTSAHAEIVGGLRRLGPRALLFLRQIEEITWSVEGGPSGMYHRGTPESLGENVRRIRLIGEEDGKADAEESWLVFSHEARTAEDKLAGHIEIAFWASQDEEYGRWSLHAIKDSPLVVFFPTILPTHLGFLVQGPYRTTPSRDNVPRNDSWNQKLVRATASLLVEALRWLRDHDLLDAATLRCLPLDRAKFGEGSMFAPLFAAVRSALGSEALLPRFEGGHIAASSARLARTQELRLLFSPSQLAGLFRANGELYWLSGDITQDRTPELHQYLIRELGITDVTPETMLPMLSEAFLDKQADDWILRLYEFLNGHPALLLQGRLEDVPLIRSDWGAHVTPKSARSWLYLPGNTEMGYSVLFIRRAVCSTPGGRKFLQSLGLTEADPVDDVIRNVLSKYRGELKVDEKEYESDLRHILVAFRTDSNAQREKLLAALREARFVKTVDAGDGVKSWSQPGEVYIGTERLRELFANVGGVLFVDDSCACLRGEDERQLLEACGATRYLRPRQVEPDWEKRQKLRERAGTTQSRSEERITDYSLQGLDRLLTIIATLDHKVARRKAQLLWEAMCDLQDRQISVFTCTYQGTYYKQRKTCEFESFFVEMLNKTAWVPDADRGLQRPALLTFDALGWKENPFLLSKIHFKRPIIAAIAKEAGIEPGVLELLKELGVTSEAELRARLGIKEQPHTLDGTAGKAGSDSGREDTGGDTATDVGSGTSGGGRTGKHPSDVPAGGGKRPPSSAGGRPFISYIGLHPDEAEPDPDGLEQQARMDLEEKAIQLILEDEPQLRRTHTNNPGFDLFEADESGQPTRWIEVKSMTSSLCDRPVGLTRVQFDCACEHAEFYWLYIVEYAADAEMARIVRIQNPAGKARTFTFDHGWLAVADVVEAAGTDAEEDD